MDSKENIKLEIGTKVYSKTLDRNLIVSNYLGNFGVINVDSWICIDPNTIMKENRCAIFNCFVDELEIGWK